MQKRVKKRSVVGMRPSLKFGSGGLLGPRLASSPSAFLLALGSLEAVRSRARIGSVVISGYWVLVSTWRQLAPADPWAEVPAGSRGRARVNNYENRGNFELQKRPKVCMYPVGR